MDGSRFLLDAWNQDNSPTIVYKGRVADGKIYVDAQEIEFGVGLFGCKLMENRVSAFRYSQDDPTIWKAVEYDISSNLVRKVNEWSSSELPTSLNFYDSPVYVWKDNKMYVVCQIGWTFSIVVFDADSLTWSKTKFIGSGRVEAISIDEDQVLTVSAIEYNGNPMKKTVYRFALR